MKIKDLDQQAKQVAEQYKKCELKLLELIIKIDAKKVYRHFGHNSLFSYITDRLGLTSAVAYNFIGVARKSSEVPELKEEVLNGSISISKARKMVSVINKDNHKLWLKIAKEKTQKQLEREVVMADPSLAIWERASYVSAAKEIKEKVQVKQNCPRIQLQLGVSEKLMLKLRRAQDLESQRLKKSVGLEDTLGKVLEIYLAKQDPLLKAKRQKLRGELQEKHDKNDRNGVLDKIDRNGVLSSNVSNKRLFSEQLANKKTSSKTKANSQLKVNAKDQNRTEVKRVSLPARIRHQVQLRDQGQCTYKIEKGKRCSARRYLDVHHIIPVNCGGKNNLENLQLLCSGHHKVEHLIKKKDNNQ